MAELPVDDAQQLVKAVVDLARMADRVLPRVGSKLTERLQDHLGVSETVPNTSTTFEMIERANLQVALDAHAEHAPFEAVGLSPDIGNYGGVSLPTLVDGNWHGPPEAALQYVSVDLGHGESIKCLRSAVVLTHFEGGPIAAMIYQSERRTIELAVEVAADTQARADAFLAHLRELMAADNVMRGRVLTFAYNDYGGFGLGFTEVPRVDRDAVILAPGRLDAIDEHALGIAEVGDALRAAGQHLKRGLLLYGPPGTGKTHTVSYLVSSMPDRTTIILTGASVGAVGQAGSIARRLAPATVVIEDVDLIGMDRGLPGGQNNPLLFQLLNEMDGLQDDDDVLFILTTNRVDILEPALAARPGRVDQAIEIGLPDADGRRRLFRLYLRQDVGSQVLDDAVTRTEGVAAAFIKELCRRATVHSIRHDAAIEEALTASITAMAEHAGPVLRTALAGDGSAPPGAPAPGWTYLPGER